MLSKLTHVGPATRAPFRPDQIPSLIDLFSPRSPHHAPSGQPVAYGDQTLWQADTIHRAKNLAQLFTSLGRVAGRLPDLRNLDETERQASALADAYAELGKSSETDAGVPCTRLLRKIATGLIALFEPDPGAIILTFASDELLLSQKRRRALILIASEMIINALKYAFPAGGGGKIGVSLNVTGNWVELVIEDNGIGLTGFELPGRGVPLIRALCSKLDATFDSTSPKHGLRINLNFRAAQRSSAGRDSSSAG